MNSPNHRLDLFIYVIPVMLEIVNAINGMSKLDISWS